MTREAAAAAASNYPPAQAGDSGSEVRTEGLTGAPAGTPLEWYRRMLLIRLFEEKLDELFGAGELRGTTHFCIGQEASAVGACSAMAAGDYVTSTHRGHGHALACGADPGRMMAEIFGKRTGYCQGKGGTQHMACLEIGFLGSNGITGGGIPIATGAALSSKLRKTGRVALCFFGEGAANQGAFHECLNMAGLWRLPVIYWCENNLYAMGTSTRQAFANPDIAARASIYGMPGVKVDGNDLSALIETASHASSRARNGEGPTLVEVETYRLRGHSRSDARAYRTREEEESWRMMDPIVQWKRHLLNGSGAREVDLEQLRQEVLQQVTEAVEFAKSSPVLEERETRTGAYRQ